MPQLPGHRYIGPGNPVDNGRPIDEDDRIAALHDIRYHNASSSDDIRSEDREAIGLFSGDFVRTGNWHSGIGALGIGAKYIGETLFGVQYPGSTTGTGLFTQSVGQQYTNLLATGSTQELDSGNKLETPPSSPYKRRKMEKNDHDDHEMQQDGTGTTTGTSKGVGSGSSSAISGTIHLRYHNSRLVNLFLCTHGLYTVMDISLNLSVLYNQLRKQENRYWYVHLMLEYLVADCHFV